MDNKQAYNLLVEYLKFLNKRSIDNNFNFSSAQKEFLKTSIDLFCEEIKRNNHF